MYVKTRITFLSSYYIKEQTSVSAFKTSNNKLVDQKDVNHKTNVIKSHT